MQIRPLHFFQHWQTVGHMYRNYPGVDTYFDELIGGSTFRPFLRWFNLPFYFWLFNQGFGLWQEDEQLAGQIYLQHRLNFTHINDIEVNKAFQGQGYSHTLLDWATQEAIAHHKAFLTLAVTLSNSRARNLYLKSGFLEQHHRFYYTSVLKSPPSPIEKFQLVKLSKRKARPNLQHFFDREIEVAEPLVAPVWQAYYRPGIPKHGVSYALYLEGYKEPQAHADLFDWPNGMSLRFYLLPQWWGTPTEYGVLYHLLNEGLDKGQLSLSLGTYRHHEIIRNRLIEFGLAERETDRMLMIKPLSESNSA